MCGAGVEEVECADVAIWLGRLHPVQRRRLGERRLCSRVGSTAGCKWQQGISLNWTINCRVCLQASNLLERIGPSLQELSLHFNFGSSNLRPFLQPCQQLQHLSLRSIGLDSARIKCIREEMGGRLRTLYLVDCCLTVS